MELYKKPVMEIVELEKVDVLTASCKCGPNCLGGTTPEAGSEVTAVCENELCTCDNHS